MKWYWLILLGLVLVLAGSVVYRWNYEWRLRPMLIEQAQREVEEFGDVEIRLSGGMNVALHGQVASREDRVRVREIVDGKYGLRVSERDNLLTVEEE